MEAEPDLLETQQKKITEELRFRKKSSIRGTPYTLKDYATSIEYMNSDGLSNFTFFLVLTLKMKIYSSL